MQLDMVAYRFVLMFLCGRFVFVDCNEDCHSIGVLLESWQVRQHL